MTFGRGETRQGSPHRQEAPRFLERWARIVSVIRRQLPRSGSSSGESQGCCHPESINLTDLRRVAEVVAVPCGPTGTA